jgi:hypothetical protein
MAKARAALALANRPARVVQLGASSICPSPALDTSALIRTNETQVLLSLPRNDPKVECDCSYPKDNLRALCDGETGRQHRPKVNGDTQEQKLDQCCPHGPKHCGVAARWREMRDTRHVCYNDRGVGDQSAR